MMKLVKPCIEYKKEYINFVKQIRRNNEIESSYTFKLSFLKFNFQKFLDYLEYISEYPKGEIVIPMKNYWAIEDGKVVGRITLRKDSGEDLFRYIGCNCVRSSFGGALWTIYLVRMLFLTSQM